MSDDPQPIPCDPPATPEVKRYQRQKLIARIINILLGLAYLVLLAFWGGPHVNAWLVGWVGDSVWLRLIACVRQVPPA